MEQEQNNTNVRTACNNQQSGNRWQKAGSTRTYRKSRSSARNGRLYGGRKPSVCNCNGGRLHTSRCKVYLSLKKRESRARLTGRKVNRPNNDFLITGNIYPARRSSKWKQLIMGK